MWFLGLQTGDICLSHLVLQSQFLTSKEKNDSIPMGFCHADIEILECRVRCMTMILWQDILHWLWFLGFKMGITLDWPLIQMHLDILPNTRAAAAQWVFVMQTKEFLSVLVDTKQWFRKRTIYNDCDSQGFKLGRSRCQFATPWPADHNFWQGQEWWLATRSMGFCHADLEIPAWFDRSFPPKVVSPCCQKPL
jgi:hypothetical protein